jgi:hypothetical protein
MLMLPDRPDLIDIYVKSTWSFSVNSSSMHDFTFVRYFPTNPSEGIDVYGTFEQYPLPVTYTEQGWGGFPLWPDIPPDSSWCAVSADCAGAKRYIVAVIRSSRGCDEVRRGLCYDAHHGWVVTVVVTLPKTCLCVLRGEVGPGGQDSASPTLWHTIPRYGIV